MQPHRWLIAGICAVTIGLVTLTGASADEDTAPPSAPTLIVPVPPSGPTMITLMPMATGIHLTAPPAAQPPETDSSDLFTRNTPVTEARTVIGPVSVQGPAFGGSSSYENATGPLNVSAALCRPTSPIVLDCVSPLSACRGGPMDIEVSVYDQTGNAVSGASVDGYVQFSDSGSTLTFPKTGIDGGSRLIFNMGNTRGGYTVAFSIHADANGNGADTLLGCWAP